MGFMGDSYLLGGHDKMTTAECPARIGIINTITTYRKINETFLLRSKLFFVHLTFKWHVPHYLTLTQQMILLVKRRVLPLNRF